MERKKGEKGIGLAGIAGDRVVHIQEPDPQVHGQGQEVRDPQKRIEVEFLPRPAQGDSPLEAEGVPDKRFPRRGKFPAKAKAAVVFRLKGKAGMDFVKIEGPQVH
jgi:hypothetical protein